MSPQSVMWPPIAIATGGAALTIQPATQADATTLARWDADPSVIACTTDDPNAERAFAGAVWADEIAGNGALTCYYIAELDARPIGAMQVIDPHGEPTHYWGEIEPNLRAIDIWIGDAADRNKGYGALMMGAAIDACFADPAVAAIDIFRSRGIEADFQPQLGGDAAKLKEIIGAYDGLAIRSATKVKAEIIAAAKKLKVIGRAGIGVDNVDIPAATAKGVVVMNTPFGNSITTAEHAIALMFAAARQVPEANASTQAGKWEKNRFMGRELYAKTLGLIGCGNIGSIVADRALGLKMKVIAYDPFLSAERAVQIGVEKVELEELLTRADVISLHVPLTEKTKNILSRENLAKTKKGVIIINAARGG